MIIYKRRVSGSGHFIIVRYSLNNESRLQKNYFEYCNNNISIKYDTHKYVLVIESYRIKSII